MRDYPVRFSLRPYPQSSDDDTPSDISQPVKQDDTEDQDISGECDDALSQSDFNISRVSSQIIVHVTGEESQSDSLTNTDNITSLGRPFSHYSGPDPIDFEEFAELERLFVPLSEQLHKLRNTTVTSLPDYNPRVRSKTYAQVIRSKLLPIGEFIVAHLASFPEADRGNIELRICFYVAVKYWPMHVSSTTHLRIMEIYRNALLVRNV